MNNDIPQNPEDIREHVHDFLQDVFDHAGTGYHQMLSAHSSAVAQLRFFTDLNRRVRIEEAYNVNTFVEIITTNIIQNGYSSIGLRSLRNTAVTEIRGWILHPEAAYLVGVDDLIKAYCTDSQGNYKDPDPDIRYCTNWTD